MTKLSVQNTTGKAVETYVTFGASGPVCPDPVGVADFSFLTAVNKVQGKFSLAAGATQVFDPKGRCFSGNICFNLLPQCPVAGADFANGKYGTSIAEFTLNVTQGDEAFDISCVNGVNSWIEMSVKPDTGWYYGPSKTPISTISNKGLGHNSGNPGVYPVNCTDCIQLVGEAPCSTLPVGPPQKERICNIQRPVQKDSEDVLAVILKDGEPPA